MDFLRNDDDKEIVEAIEIYLTQDGHQVLEAYDGIEAVEILKKESVDQLQSYSFRPLHVRPTAGEFFDILVAYLSRNKPVLQAV